MEDLRKALLEKASLLPEEKQQQIVDFIDFLVSKYVAENPNEDIQADENLFEFLDRSVDEMKADPKRLTWEEIKAAE